LALRGLIQQRAATERSEVERQIRPGYWVMRELCEAVKEIYPNEQQALLSFFENALHFQCSMIAQNEVLHVLIPRADH
jgi:hypothetical protein